MTDRDDVRQLEEPADRGSRYRRLPVPEAVPRLSRGRAIGLLAAVLGALILVTVFVAKEGESPAARAREAVMPRVETEPLDPERIEALAERLRGEGRRIGQEIERLQAEEPVLSVRPDPSGADEGAVGVPGRSDRDPAHALEERAREIRRVRQAALVPDGVGGARAESGSVAAPGSAAERLPPSPREVLALLEGSGGPSPAAPTAPLAGSGEPGTAGGAGHEVLLPEGTQIGLVLMHRVVSEIAGPVRAMVARDVRDWSGREVVLPRGSIVHGQQSGQPGQGDRRLMIEWRRARRPDGSVIELGAPAAGVDGALGVVGQLDSHWMARLGSAAVVSLVGAGVQLSQPDRGLTAGLTEREVVAGEVGLSLGRVAQELLRAGLDRGPTVTLEPGARLAAVVSRDLLVEPW